MIAVQVEDHVGAAAGLVAGGAEDGGQWLGLASIERDLQVHDGPVLVGDVHPDAVNTAGAITPVPGGVGPMTITMLMSNTVKAARLRRASPRVSATQSTASAR